MLKIRNISTSAYDISSDDRQVVGLCEIRALGLVTVAVFADSLDKIKPLKRKIQAYTLSNLCQLE